MSSHSPLVTALAFTVAATAAAAAFTACAGPRAAQEPAAAASAPQAAPLPDTLTFQADVAPIRALAYGNGWLWIGSDRGLRRVRVPSGPAEWIGAEAGLVGRGISALATDGTGRILVATDAEVGRLSLSSDAAARPRYQTIAKLPAATQIAPALVPRTGDAIWAGTAAGLFVIDGGNIVAVDGVRGAPLTSLDLDDGGDSIWAGVAGRGLIQVDRATRKVIAAVGPEAPERFDFVQALGTALLANGTRVGIGRGADGKGRVVVLRRTGPEILNADSDVTPLLLIARHARDPLLVASTRGGTPRLYRLAMTERGQLVSDGVVRFTPARKSLQGVRLTAFPQGSALPPDVTIAIAAGAVSGPASSGGLPGDADGSIFLGTRAVGVAQLTAPAAGAVGGRPLYLSGGELAFGARAFSVACVGQHRCLFATGAGQGWRWDGGDRPFTPVAAATAGGPLLAVAGDGRSAIYVIAATAGAAKALQIGRMSTDGARTDPVLTVPIQVEGTPTLTFATLSPQGALWIAVRDRAPSGQEFGRGVLELQLSAGRTVHHRPYRQGEPRAPDAIPIAGDVNAVRFQKPSGAGDPQAIWFCTSLGVLRFLGGQLSQWGESDGLDSETCSDLEIAADGTVWAATAAGVARFDGKGWRRLDGAGGGWPTDRDGDALAARTLVASGQGLWAGTARGLWPIAAPPAQPAPGRGASAAGAGIDAAAGLVDDDVVALATDRFGRVWVLGRIGVTVRRPLAR